MNKFLVIDGSSQSNNTNFTYYLPAPFNIKKIALLSAQINQPYTTTSEPRNCQFRIGVGVNINTLTYYTITLPTTSYVDVSALASSINTQLTGLGIGVSCTGDNNTLKLTFTKTNDGNILHINSNFVDRSNLPRILGLIGGNISTYEFTCLTGQTITSIKPVDLIQERILYLSLGTDLPANNIVYENGLVASHFIIPMTSSRGSLVAQNSSFQNILDYGNNNYRVSKFDVKLMNRYGEVINPNCGPIILILEWE